MELYKIWFENNIIRVLKEIKMFSDRIQFLYDEKTKFISLNKNEDANQIVIMFDTLIEKERILQETNSKAIDPSKIVVDYSNNS